MSSLRDERTRLVLLLAAVLWFSALAALFVGFRLRLRPILLVGGLDALLALFVTLLGASTRFRR